MKLSAVILTKNEEEMLGECLESVKWADEIVVVDDGSTDKTCEIAKNYTDKLFSHKMSDFASQRNFGLEKATGDWILYVDADERITPELKEEILTVINYKLQVSGASSLISAYKVPRKNIFLGKWQRHGSFWPDYVHKLFKRSALRGWQGELHESPVFEGQEGKLKNALMHISHRSIEEMLLNTINWSGTEAKLRYQAGHPQVVWWRILRIGFGEFFKRYFKLAGILDGKIGLFEAYYQSISMTITYVRLWEAQSNAERK